MKCDHCSEEFEEKEIQESHDVPCYLFYFELSRKEKKHYADKYTRRWLCIECHQEYEYRLHEELVKKAVNFGKKYFFGGKNASL